MVNCSSTVELDPKSIEFKTLKDIKWVPVPAGSYIIHRGGQVHFEGAKGEEAIIQGSGIGPVATEQLEK